MNAISSIVIELVGSMGVPQEFAAQSAARLLPPSRHFEGSNVETNASTSVGSLTCSVRNPTEAQSFAARKVSSAGYRPKLLSDTRHRNKPEHCWLLPRHGSGASSLVRTGLVPPSASGRTTQAAEPPTEPEALHDFFRLEGDRTDSRDDIHCHHHARLDLLGGTDARHRRQSYNQRRAGAADHRFGHQLAPGDRGGHIKDHRTIAASVDRRLRQGAANAPNGAAVNSAPRNKP